MDGQVLNPVLCMLGRTKNAQKFTDKLKREVQSAWYAWYDHSNLLAREQLSLPSIHIQCKS